MTTLKGIFADPKPPRKKNFLQENVRSLRQMEKYFQSTKEIQELHKMQLQPPPSNRYQAIASRVNSSLRGSVSIQRNYQSADAKLRLEGQPLSRKSSAPVVSKDVETTTTKKLYKRPGDIDVAIKPKKEERQRLNQKTERNLPKALLDLNLNGNSTSLCDSPTKRKTISQGSQTLEPNHLLYEEGTIRYPSTSSSQKRNSLRIDHENDPDHPSDRGDISPDGSHKKDTVDYVKLNKEKLSVANKMAAQLSNGVLPTSYRKGVVPKYILERKEEQHQKEIERAKDEAYLADCPEGHIPLPDNERKETLRMLKQNYQGFVDELNKMPIRSDTLRSRKRKMEIEKQLSKLEEGIKVFSRPKVFVKINS